VRKKLPNIILLVLDTVGAKHLSIYNYHRPTTPNLERIARDCTVYTRCFAPACWTVPSHASMFTGLYPSQHGAFENRYLLRDNLPHLVPILQATGYRTLGISTNSLVSPASGLCQGFDEFHDLGFRDLSRILAGLKGQVPGKNADPDTLATLLRSEVSAKSAASTLLQYLWETGRAGEVLQKTWKMVTNQMGKWLRPGPIDNATPFTKKTLALMRQMFQRQRSNDSPFFLFVNILQAHQNYCPPWRWRRFSRCRDRAAASPQKFYFQPDSPALARLVATYQNLYDDELRYLDAVVGRFWELLHSAALLDDTLVIITSDHGEHFGERGHYTHILSLYNELIWVPLIMHLPRRLARPGLDPRLVSLTDLYATILDLVDSPLPRPETSFSLLAPPRRELAIAQCVHPEMWQIYLESKQALSQSQDETFSPPVFAVMTERGLKIIEKKDGGLEVYDLKESLVENRDLAPALSPEVLANYRHLLEHLKTETGFQEAMAAWRAPADQRAA
jgi:arylsulfatase A-like enzyme